MSLFDLNAIKTDSLDVNFIDRDTSTSVEADLFAVNRNDGEAESIFRLVEYIAAG